MTVVRPTGDQQLSRDDLCSVLTGSCQSPGVVRAGVRDRPQPPQTQHLLEVAELFRASRAIHGGGIFAPELRVVLLGEDMQDLDRVVRIRIIGGVCGH
jgi:hypothetical protein